MINANEVNTADLAAWKLNGQPVTAINKFVTEADACDHHIYLQVPDAGQRNDLHAADAPRRDDLRL